MTGAHDERVLVVEDHDLLREVLVRTLRAEGMDVDRVRPEPADRVVGAVRDGGHGAVVVDLDDWSRRTDVDRLLAGLRAGVSRLVILAGTAEVAQLAADQRTVDQRTADQRTSDERTVEQLAPEHGAGVVIRKDRPATATRAALIEALRAAPSG